MALKHCDKFKDASEDVPGMHPYPSREIHTKTQL